MIGATKKDFEGFLIETSDTIKLDGNKVRVVLCNASVKNGSRRGSVLGWPFFPDLSKQLLDLGFDVILLAQEGELKGCCGKNFVGKLTLAETAGVMKQCDVIICPDTGLMHVADALGIPIILLMGPSHMTKSGPLVSKYRVVRKFISCAPCYQTGLWDLCTDRKCMDMIEVSDVLSTLFSMKLRDPIYDIPQEAAVISPVIDGKKKIKIVIPYYSGEPRVEEAKRTWLYPEVVFALSEQDTKIREESFYEFENGASLGLSDRPKPLLKPIMKRLLSEYPDMDYYGFFNSDIILPHGKSVYQLLPDGEKVAALHHRLDIDSKGRSSRYVGKDGFFLTRDVLIDFLDEFPNVILGAGGWDGGLFFWLWSKYGESKVDLRFDEVLHKSHEKGWKSGDKDTDYNREQVRPYRFFADWDALGAKYGSTLREVAKREKVGIIQPLRLGDLIIILPIARWYFDNGYEIVWPICSEWVWLQHYVNYVKFVDIGKEVKNAYQRAKEYLSKDVDKVLDLGMGIGRPIDLSFSFDFWKYHEAKVPFSERKNLKINRDYEKEEALKKHLNLSKPYTVTHSYGSAIKKYDFGQKNSVEIKPIPGFTLFDWIGVLEDADYLYCIDSSIANIAEGLGILKNRRVLKFNDNVKDGFNRVTFHEDWENVENLPVHFFTLVYNGMPFIKYHLEVFKMLPFKWHWHIIEGPAQHGQDRGSKHHKARGGDVTVTQDDGTTAYLNEIMSDPRVTVYRKDIWNGKVDMANAPLQNIKEKCVLWQIDSDELYSLEDLTKAYNLFMMRPEKNIGIIGFYQFVGPNKYVLELDKYDTLLDTWGTHKYARLFRYVPGLKWTSHAPPTLSYDKIKSIDLNMRIHHYAYVLEKQIEFKSQYYGYRKFLDKWRKLQETDGVVKLGDFFPWLTGSNVLAGDWNSSILMEL